MNLHYSPCRACKATAPSAVGSGNCTHLFCLMLEQHGTTPQHLAYSHVSVTASFVKYFKDTARQILTESHPQKLGGGAPAHSPPSSRGAFLSGSFY